MIVTEEEAMGLSCPNNPGNKCEASECMAWRWFEERPSTEEVFGGMTDEEMSLPIMQNEKLLQRMEAGSYAHGYCGLAGKPEFI